LSFGVNFWVIFSFFHEKEVKMKRVAPILYGGIMIIGSSIYAQFLVIESSSTTCGGFYWGSDWWWPNSHHEKRFAECRVRTDFTESLYHPTYLNIIYQYSQAVGSCPVKIYIDDTKQLTWEGDSPYHHWTWFNGDLSDLDHYGHYVGEIIMTSTVSMASFNVENWISAHPADVYFLLFDQQDATIHDVCVILAWLGPPGSYEAVKETRTKSVEFGLLNIYPNPTFNITSIEYVLEKREPVSIEIYNASGQLIKVLQDKQLQRSGYHKVIWDGTDNTGRIVPNGVYFCRLSTPSQILRKKLILVR